MKTRFALLCSLALACLTLSAEADPVIVPDAVLTGTLLTESNIPGQPNTKVALTKKQLLSFFGYTQVNPAKTAFYADQTNNGHAIIALSSKDGSEVYGVLIDYNLNDTSDIGTSPKGTTTIYGPANVFSGSLTGNAVSTVQTTKQHGLNATKLSYTITAVGALGGSSENNALLQAKFSGMIILPK